MTGPLAKWTFYVTDLFGEQHTAEYRLMADGRIQYRPDGERWRPAPGWAGKRIEDAARHVKDVYTAIYRHMGTLDSVTVDDIGMTEYAEGVTP